MKSDVIFSVVTELGEDLYQSKKSFFNGAKFLIKPTKREIENGIMVPGHRFYPFCSDKILPHEMALTCADKKVKSLKFLMKYEDTIVYHTLIDNVQYKRILRDNKENAKKIKGRCLRIGCSYGQGYK